MYILGIDLETTGTDVASDAIVEVGAALWDVESKKPLRLMSEFVSIAPKTIPQEVSDIIGITNGDLERFGRPLKDVLAQLADLTSQAEYMVAHNGLAFDKIVLDRHLVDFPEIEIRKPWIDTMNDVPYPETIKTRKLSYLAAEHGFLNPFSHRAAFDVLTMLTILGNYDFAEVIKLQQSPLIKVIADVTFEEREKARENGFRWDRNNRQWYIEMKQIQLEEKSFPFPISVELS